MKKLHYSTTIDASREKVWEILLGKDSYPKWTQPFSENSRVETDWKEGSRAIFRGGDSDDGMIARIATNKPNQFLSIEHIGMITGGKEDLTSDAVKKWAGAKENYTLTEKMGKLFLTLIWMRMKSGPDILINNGRKR